MRLPHSIAKMTAAFRITAIYTLVAGCWIIFSDAAAVRLARSSEEWLRLSQYKGLLFVAVTAALLFVLVERSFRHLQRSRARLEETERRFTAFMEHLPVGAYLKDESGRYVYANSFWTQRFAAESGATDRKAAELFPAELAASFERYHRETLELGQPTHEMARIPEKSGERTWLITRFPVAVASGGPRLVGGFCLDITERLELEDQLRQASKMEAVGRLAGGVAHDFNNLLTVINGYAELLQAGPNAPPTAVKEIAQAGRRAAELTRQLLAFSRRQILTPERVRLDEVVAGMHSLLARLIGEQIRLDIVPARTLRHACVDPNQAEQVVMNLVVNARDALKQNGVITIRTDDVELPERRRLPGRTLEPGAYVRLMVSDTGRGIPADVLDHIFEPFFTTKRAGEGTGLGLSTVYGIVQQSGGAIEVDSLPGQGTTFAVYLPAVD